MSRIVSDLATLLRSPPALELLAAGPPRPTHLVGGALRDWLLDGTVSDDWDLIVDGWGRAYAERLAQHLHGRLVEPAGGRFAIFRVVSDGLRIDLWDRDGSTLDAELERRDFTINSIAFELNDATLHDPLGGRSDLAAGLLRSNRADTFRSDPLRVLRLLRFELDLAGFHATEATLGWARRSAREMTSVAAERVREELDRVLSRRRAPHLGARLRALDLHPRLWAEPGATGAEGPNPGASLDTWLARAEGAATEPLPDGWLAALRHAALLLEAARERPTEANDLLARGWISGRTARRIERLLEPRQRPRDEGEGRLYLHRIGPAWAAAAAFDGWRASEDEGGGEWGTTVERLGKLARADPAEIFDPPPLLRGDEIASALEIDPGPELGRVVERLRRLQIARKLCTPDAARAWLAGSMRGLPSPRD